VTRLHLLPALALAACPSGHVPEDSDPSTGAATADASTGEPTGGAAGGPCADAEARLGLRVCAHEVADAAAWAGLSLPSDLVDQARTGKFLLPARDGARLPALVMDVHAYDLHYRFLREAFPDEFGDLAPDEYEAMISDPARREFWAGPLVEYRTADDDRVFGYAVWDPQTDAATTVTCAEFQAVHAALSAVFHAGTLAAVPSGDLQRAVLADCDVPRYDAAAAVDYEPYTVAAGFGTLRRYTPAQFAAATAQAAYGFQDVLVLQEAPLDVERVVSGAVTGGRQAELSHLNVRSAARGTPNCYLRDAYARLAAWEGRLVRLECTRTGLEVREATPAEAQAGWDALRPDPVELPAPDLDWPELAPLLALPTATADERAQSIRRYGAKGRNLAALYQRVDPALQIPGLVVPFHWYAAFVADNYWIVDLGAGLEQLPIAEAIDRLLADPAFRSDPALRRRRLEQLHDAIRAGTCDPALLAALAPAMLAAFADADTMARFRSSSNAEDGLVFNGAGLYESTSGCLADQLDADAAGPSRCDPAEPEERDVCRALKKVWASLWLPRAFEEREWYGIDHARAAMGVLVDLRLNDEAANMVVFSGDPNLAGDDRVLVNAQVGELEVVSPDPGTWPEKTRLTLADGVVTEIDRVRGSSELPEGEHVLADAELQQLGAAMAEIAAVFPIDDDPPPGTTLLLDTEWKLRPDRSLMIKQIRPFLRHD
jgi:hypothetical protein